MPADQHRPLASPRVDPAAVGVVGIIGAGPAGLTAAHELTRHDVPVEVFEATDVVGGISQTVERDGFRFDIGGHRFFTKVSEVEALWHELLDGPDEMLRRPRMSRILYRGRLFDYPLKAGNALGNLGLLEAVRCVLSYLWARVRPPTDQTTFEGWVAARFGWRLYRIFFKTYTEKVWGVSADAIQADWAAQRIKNLSLPGAVLSALRLRRGEQITSLIEEFDYPRLGPGMMWERARDRLATRGVPVRMESRVLRLEHADGRVRALVTAGPEGERRTAVDHVISSMPLGDLVQALDPAPPDAVLRAATALTHRDFLTVALVLPRSTSFPDNWIYVHDPAVRVGRVQNFGSWSPHLVKDGATCLGMEYFVFEGDDLWSAADDDLVEMATRELVDLGLAPEGAVSAGHVVRMPKAYPVYDADYQDHVTTIRSWLEAHLPDVVPVGRNGMHRYNNADHSMMTALLAARNVLGARPRHDVWAVNVEEDYHEEDHRGQDELSHRAAERTASRHGTGRDAPVLPARAG